MQETTLEARAQVDDTVADQSGTHPEEPQTVAVQDVLEQPLAEAALVASVQDPPERLPTDDAGADSVPVQQAEPEPVVSPFEAMGLGPATLRAIADLGFDEPTPIQEQTIRLLLAGRDVIAEAPTGTGKTAAYGLPIIEHLDEDDLRPQAIIVVPTRELALQVSEAMHAFGKYRKAVTLPIYGGAPYERQFRALARGVQIVVGTPGRLIDHLGRGTLDLSAIRNVVLDEADEMLNMGFIEDIEEILSTMPEGKQGALFSATIPPRIGRLAERYLKNPEHVSVTRREALAPRVKQVYFEVPGPGKAEALARILDLEQPESAIVFVRTRRDADVLAEKLNGLGYLAEAIHGDITQSQRERALMRFRQGHTQLLVATDVAARGLDIPDVSHVINYDLPPDAEQYVHRIGRTGRAGRTGQAITLVTPRERRNLTFIERGIHRRLQRMRLPTPVDIAARRRALFREEVLKILDGGELDPFISLVEDLSDSRDPAELAAAAFKMAVHSREGNRPDLAALWSQSIDQELPPMEIAEPERFNDRQRDSRPARPNDRRDGRDGGRFGDAPPHQFAQAPAGPRGRERAGEGMTRLFLGVGRDANVRPTDLVGAIANEAGLPGYAIGDIDIYDSFSFVEVPSDSAETVLTALNGTQIRGVRPNAKVARADEGPQGRGDRPGGGGGFRGGQDRGFPPRRPSTGDRERGPSRDSRPPFRARRDEGRPGSRPFDQRRRDFRD